MARTKKADRIYQMWKSANSEERIKWQSESQKGYDFYLNEQLTKEELDNLKESGMPSFQVNRITPIIETMKYFVVMYLSIVGHCLMVKQYMAMLYLIL